VSRCQKYKQVSTRKHMSASVVLKAVAFIVKENETRYALTVFPPLTESANVEGEGALFRGFFREPNSSGFDIFVIYFFTTA